MQAPQIKTKPLVHLHRSQLLNPNLARYLRIPETRILQFPQHTVDCVVHQRDELEVYSQDVCDAIRVNGVFPIGVEHHLRSLCILLSSD